MTLLQLLYFLDGFFAIWLLPIIYIWCVKPDKSLREGFRNWFYESEDDI